MANSKQKPHVRKWNPVGKHFYLDVLHCPLGVTVEIRCVQNDLPARYQVWLHGKISIALRVLVDVGMVAAGERPVGSTDLVARGVSGYPKNLVIVAFCLRIHQLLSLRFL